MAKSVRLTSLTLILTVVKEEIERQLPSLIDNPTDYTMRGFRLYPATKRKLLAEVDFRVAMGRGTQGRDYLSPLVYGGERKLKSFERSLQRVGLLPSGMAAVPGNAAKLDAYGNMSRGQIVQILSYFKAFGEQGYRANISDKRKAAMAQGSKRTGARGISYFVGKPSVQVTSRCTWWPGAGESGAIPWTTPKSQATPAGRKTGSA